MFKIFLGITIVFLALNECFSSPNQIHARPSKSRFFLFEHHIQFGIILFKKIKNKDIDLNLNSKRAPLPVMITARTRHSHHLRRRLKC